jgi:hypothetical protein
MRIIWADRSGKWENEGKPFSQRFLMSFSSQSANLLTTVQQVSAAAASYLIT